MFPPHRDLSWLIAVGFSVESVPPKAGLFLLLFSFSYSFLSKKEDVEERKKKCFNFIFINILAALSCPQFPGGEDRFLVVLSECVRVRACIYVRMPVSVRVLHAWVWDRWGLRGSWRTCLSTRVVFASQACLLRGVESQCSVVPWLG